MGTIFHKYLRKLILKNTLDYYDNIELNIINLHYFHFIYLLQCKSVYSCDFNLFAQ